MALNTVIFGGKGMLARALREQLQARGMEVVGYDLPDFDLARTTDVAGVFHRDRPDIVFNCAAFTKVDACEEQEELANRVNGECVGTLAEMCRHFGARLVHVSTDFVFDGQGTRPYRPDDEPAPLSAYGRSKLLGERLLRQVDPERWTIVRTAWLYGLGGASFPRTMVEMGRQGRPLKVVNDQVGSPTYTEDLAAAMIDLAVIEANGIYHCTNADETNWYEFARATLDAFGVKHEVEPISTEAYLQIRPNQAKRPRYSVLDRTGLEEALGRKMRGWREALGAFAEAAREGF